MPFFAGGLQSWVHVSGVHSGIFLLIELCGVAGVLEVNFVQPAHDKQGIECTTILARLESCLLQMFVHLMWDKKKQCILLAQAFCRCLAQRQEVFFHHKHVAKFLFIYLFLFYFYFFCCRWVSVFCL